MVDRLRDMVSRHTSGTPEGTYSVCSAHPLVLTAAARQAVEDGTWLLVEATSNQVDQFGGYTGMRPAEFRDHVRKLTLDCGLPPDRLVLGGDHLGPNRWQSLPADDAMILAEALVEAYVEAGYTKIHLDCSMSCADDPAPLDVRVVAERATRLLAVAERTAARHGANGSLSYVIGSEVPVPGGAHETIGALSPTSHDAARATLDAHHAAFTAAGLAHCWPRVCALVVQPAVEFDHAQVIDYVSEATASLRTVLADEPTMVFEAHSTDYQTPDRLRDLVRDHWAILKVGPGLTFALREALFALAAIESELLPPERTSRLREVVEERMIADPRYWRGYYKGTDREQRIARGFSYSDRVRYYLPDAEITEAVATVFANLDRVGIPEPLVSQYLPLQYARVRAGRLTCEPAELAVDRVRDALRPYAAACHATTESITTGSLK